VIGSLCAGKEASAAKMVGATGIEPVTPTMSIAILPFQAASDSRSMALAEQRIFPYIWRENVD
jgi:hypothetical protein